MSAPEAPAQTGRTCDKFDQFNEESYKRQYKADRLYSCLEKYLDKYVPEGSHIIEIGCGANVPGLSWLAKHRENITADVFEPSQMVESAERLVAGLPHAANFHCHRMAANEAVASNPRKADVVILNRMLHEWRLYDLRRTGQFDLAKELRTVGTLLKRGGIMILGDFAYADGIPEAVLQVEMEALLKRLGHTHPPADYVRMDTAIAALSSEKVDLPDLPRFRLMECEILCDTEADTQRYYWMTASERMI